MQEVIEWKHHAPVAPVAAEEVVAEKKSAGDDAAAGEFAGAEEEPVAEEEEPAAEGSYCCERAERQALVEKTNEPVKRRTNNKNISS